MPLPRHTNRKGINGGAQWRKLRNKQKHSEAREFNIVPKEPKRTIPLIWLTDKKKISNN